MRKSWIEVDYLESLRYRAALAYGNEAQQAVRFAACLDPDGYRAYGVDSVGWILDLAKAWGVPEPQAFDTHDGLTWPIGFTDLPVWQWRNVVAIQSAYNLKTLMHIPPVLAQLAEGKQDDVLNRICRMPAPCGMWLEQLFDWFSALAVRFPSIYDAAPSGTKSHAAIERFAELHSPAEQLTYLVAGDSPTELQKVLRMPTTEFLAIASYKVDNLRMQNAIAASAAPK